MKDLSIIILSYNTKDITEECIRKLLLTLQQSSLETEVIIADNNSIDGSPEMLLALKSEYSSTHCLIEVLLLPENIGYARANNKALTYAKGRYILYLNSDVMMDHIDFNELIHHMDTFPHIGALTVRVNLTPDQIDPASHRGFPTLWRSFCYFSGLEKIFGSTPLLNRIFGGYHLTWHPIDQVHEIDSPTGAFFLARKQILDELRGFDEQFFMYGEDIDLAFRIKKLGHTIQYYPLFSVTHLKNKSGLKHTDAAVRSKIRGHFYEAMKIFYKKHYEKKYPNFVDKIVYFLISMKQKYG